MAFSLLGSLGSDRQAIVLVVGSIWLLI